MLATFEPRPPRHRSWRPLALLLVLLSAVGCEPEPAGEGSDRGAQASEPAAPEAESPTQVAAGGPAQAATPTAAMASGRAALPPARPAPTGAFFGLGPLQADVDRRPFAFSTGPKPPPRIGEVIALPVPAPPPPAGGTAPEVSAEPLKVVRSSPNGRVGVVAGVTAQFNQPMVPVASLADLERLPVPLQVAPALQAQARWLGTRTVALESQARLPFSTLYTATVPAGTRSATGSALGAATTWTFETPRVQVTASEPAGNQVRPEDLVVLHFNQDIEPRAIAALARLMPATGSAVPLSLVEPKAWPTLTDLRARLASADPRRTVVLRPGRLLARDTAYRVQLPAGCPSAEGPLKSEAPWNGGFRTYPKLSISKVSCDWREGTSGCREGAPVRVVTSTVPAADQDLAALVKLEPAVTNLQVQVSGRGLLLQGDFLASTRYRLELGGGLRDIFGQTLGKGWSGSLSYRDGEPILQLPTAAPVVLEAARPAQMGVRVRNLDAIDVTMFTVDADHLHDAYRLGASWWSQRKADPLDELRGKVPAAHVVRRTLKPKLARNVVGRVALPLNEGLRGRKDGLLAVSLSTDWPQRSFWQWGKKGYATALVQVTDIGLTARWDHDKLVVLAARLSSGQPLAQAAVSLTDGRGKTLGQGLTDGRGVLELPVQPWSYDQSRFVLARVGGESGHLRLTQRVGGPARPEDLQSFIYTEKAPYKPGETAHINGLLRWKDNRREGGVLPLGEGVSLSWTLSSARGIELAKGTLAVGAGGGFHVEVPLPEDMDLGHARFRATLQGGRTSRRTITHNFQVQHFRAPEFEVSAALRPVAASAGGVSKVPPALVFGDEAELEAVGRYYFGATMGGARVSWQLWRNQGSFRPAGHDGWHFGQPIPWWRHHRAARKQVASGTGVLDDDGRLRARHLLDPGQGPERIDGVGAYQLEVSVTDESRQQISARASAVVHPSLAWAGLKADRTVVQAGHEVRVEVVAVDVRGTRQSRPVELTLLRLDPARPKPGTPTPYGFRGRGGWGPVEPPVEVQVATCSVQAQDPASLDVDGRLKPGTCTLRPPQAGAYLVRARLRDDQGRVNVSDLAIHAFGEQPVRWMVHDEGVVELLADKPSYLPGETATVLIKSPYPSAHGLLSIERGGMISWRVLELKSAAGAERVELSGRWVPGAHVSVTLFRGRLPGKGAQAELEGKPATARGELTLAIERIDKRIEVEIKPAAPTIVPGGELDLALRTTDGRGRPMGANVTLFAVDEGVLALLGFETPAPLTRFHVPRPAGATGADLRTAILVENFARLQGQEVLERKVRTKSARREAGPGARPPPAPMAMAEAAAPMEGAAPDDDAGDVGGEGPAPRLRALFASTAFFKAALRTGPDGALRLKLKLPDNTTTFRIMAVADDGEDRFGHGEGQVTTRQPVLLRATLPRFASLEDDFDAAAMLHNQTGRTADFLVGARASGVTWHDDFEKKVRLKDGEAREVFFRVRAEKPGRATFQFAARVRGSQLASEADALQLSIPVNLPATLEAFATYGSTTSSVRQPIKPPKDAMKGFGGLDIALSSTALGGFEDAARYLYEYPYECAEQTASRLIPIAVLGEILEQFQIGELKDRSKRMALAERAVKRLVDLQHWDGGFKFWSSARQSSRWITPWVTFSLLLARKEGVAVPPKALEKANRYMRGRLRSGWPKDQLWWRSADVLALWVLSHPINDVAAGLPDKGLEPLAQRLYDVADDLPVFSRLWLMTVAHRLGEGAVRDRILADLDNRIAEKAGTAHIAEAVSEDLRVLMHSSDRTDAIAVGALLEVRPKHPALPKLVKGLMDARILGRWSTTQSNAWALVSARAYFDRFEQVVPDYTTAIWLGKGGFLGSARFKGRSLATSVAAVPMATVLEQAAREPGADTVDLILSRQGQGRMYYRVGMRYAPKDLKLPPAEQGLTVQRSYRALRDEDAWKVQRQPDGSWRVAAGAEVRVDLTLVVPTRAHYVVLDDPLPAGFEPLNPAFRTSSGAAAASGPVAAGGFHWYRWWSWNHKEMRDDRVLLFADRLWAGVYSHSYTARATTPGRFVAGPARAEEMYAPETFGRTETAFVEVIR